VVLTCSRRLIIIYSLPLKNLQNEEDVSEEGTADEAPLAALLPVEILAQTGSFPLALVSPPYSQVSGDHLQMLLAFIPPEEDAVRFRDAAFPHAFFMYVSLDGHVEYIAHGTC
jgi:hypothetical protein